MKYWFQLLVLFVFGCLFWVIPPRDKVHAQTPGIGAFGPTAQQSVTGTAAVVGMPPSTTICIKALDTNTSPALIYLGNSASVTTSTGYPLAAGQAACVPALLPIYTVASGAGSSIAWFTTTQ